MAARLQGPRDESFQRGYLVLNNSIPAAANNPSFSQHAPILHPVTNADSEQNATDHRIWTYSPKDEHKRYIIPQEWKFEMTTPLLNKNKASFGILYLTRDLRKHPLTAHTMRRIESLRRSLVIAIEKLENQTPAGKVKKKKRSKDKNAHQKKKKRRLDGKNVFMKKIITIDPRKLTAYLPSH